MDPEVARDVVRRCDHAAAVRVTTDDQRLRAQLRLLELLDRREEGVEVEVRDDHGSPEFDEAHRDPEPARDERHRRSPGR